MFRYFIGGYNEKNLSEAKEQKKDVIILSKNKSIKLSHIDSPTLPSLLAMITLASTMVYCEQSSNGAQKIGFRAFFEGFY